MYKRNYNFLNFKGISKDTNEWVFGTPVKAENGDIIIIDESLAQTAIKRETLCQKTNSTDNIGKAVFEGDLVEMEQGIFKKNKIIGCVRFGDEPGYLDSHVSTWKIDWAEPLRFETKDFKIIGNVYDDNFHDAEYLKENWPDDWEHIKYFIEKEAREE